MPQLERLSQAVQKGRNDQRDTKAEVDSARFELTQAKASADAFATRPVKVTLILAKPKSELDLLFQKHQAVQRRQGQLQQKLKHIEERADKLATVKADLDFDAGRHRLDRSKLEPDRQPHQDQLNRLDILRAQVESLTNDKKPLISQVESDQCEIIEVMAGIAAHSKAINALTDSQGQIRQAINHTNSTLSSLDEEKAQASLSAGKEADK